jgi:hypothetical protein
MNTPKSGMPLCRAGLVVETVGDEVIVIDQDSGRAHCVSGLAAAIWERCDGAHDVTRLATYSGADAERVEAALVELDELGLLECVADQSSGLTRRTVAQRAITAGAGMLVLSVALPTVASAASTKIGPGQNAPNCTAAPGAIKADPECSSGSCYQTHNGSSKTCTTSGCLAFGGVCLLGLVPCCAGAGTCTGIITLTCSN